MNKYKKRLKVMSKLEKLLAVCGGTLILVVVVLSINSVDLGHQLDSSTQTVSELSSEVTSLEQTIKDQDVVIDNLKNPDITKSVTIPATEAKYQQVTDGKDVTLGYGTYTVGEDIEPGSYNLTPTSGYGNLFVYGIFGGTSYSHIFGFNQFDEGATRTVKNVDLSEGQSIEIDDVEIEFTANSSKQLVTEAHEESVETMTKTYNDKGEVDYSCTKDDGYEPCEDLEKYDSLRKAVDKEED